MKSPAADAMQPESPTSGRARTHTHTGSLHFREDDIVTSHSASYATPTFVTGATMKDGTGGCEANDSIEPKA
jgi:hypothetical protein